MVVQVATPVYNPFGDGLSQCDGHTWVNPLDDGHAWAVPDHSQFDDGHTRAIPVHSPFGNSHAFGGVIQEVMTHEKADICLTSHGQRLYLIHDW